MAVMLAAIGDDGARSCHALGFREASKCRALPMDGPLAHACIAFPSGGEAVSMCWVAN